MTSNAHKLAAAIALAALSIGLAAPPAFANGRPDSQPAQTIRNLSLKLPIGTLDLLDANLKVTKGKDNQPESFRGTARVKLPAVGPLANLKMSDLVRADVGLDTGAALSYLGAPLDEERRYLFLEFGGGLNLSRVVTESDGTQQQLILSSPAGQGVVVVIDPEQPLMFVQGKINVAYTGDLAVIGNLLAARGLNLSMLDNVQIPGLSTFVISGTIAPGTDKSFVELQARTGIDAGVVGAAIGVQAAPLALQGGARVDSDGLTVSGVTESRVAPQIGWDGSGKVQLHVPFDGEQAFVDLTGALSAPLAQLKAEGSKRVTVDGQVIANAVQHAASAAGSVAQGAGSAISNTVQLAATAAAQASGAAVSGVQGAVSGAVSAAPTAVSSASTAASASWQTVMQQVCKAAKRC